MLTLRWGCDKGTDQSQKRAFWKPTVLQLNVLIGKRCQWDLRFTVCPFYPPNCHYYNYDEVNSVLQSMTPLRLLQVRIIHQVASQRQTLNILIKLFFSPGSRVCSAAGEAKSSVYWGSPESRAPPPPHSARVWAPLHHKCPLSQTSPRLAQHGARKHSVRTATKQMKSAVLPMCQVTLYSDSYIPCQWLLLDVWLLSILWNSCYLNLSWRAIFLALELDCCGVLWTTHKIIPNLPVNECSWIIDAAKFKPQFVSCL